MNEGNPKGERAKWLIAEVCKSNLEPANQVAGGLLSDCLSKPIVLEFNNPDWHFWAMQQPWLGGKQGSQPLVGHLSGTGKGASLQGCLRIGPHWRHPAACAWRHPRKFFGQPAHPAIPAPCWRESSSPARRGAPLLAGPAAPRCSAFGRPFSPPPRFLGEEHENEKRDWVQAFSKPKSSGEPAKQRIKRDSGCH